MVIEIIIDTGTWMKLDKLISNKIIKEDFILTLYNHFKIVITPQIRKELEYMKVNSWIEESTTIYPIIKKEEYNRAISDGFDKADSSIFGLEHDSNNTFIISEDRPLVKYGKIYRINIMFFIDFLTILLTKEFITKRKMYQLNEELFKLRNINKKKYKKVKNICQNF